MIDSIFLTKITRLACDEPFAAQRRREPSAQELCLQSVMIEAETAMNPCYNLPPEQRPRERLVERNSWC